MQKRHQMIIKKANRNRRKLKKNDVIICTALIKSAPRILTEDLVKLMKPGSIIYDLAAEQEEIPFQKLVRLI